MKIRTIICLVVIASGLACKKEKHTQTTDGIVLQLKDKSPVAGAQVELLSGGPVGSNLIYKTTTSNSKGEFHFEYPEPYNIFLWVTAKKEGLVTCPGYSITQLTGDTLFMEDARYIRFIVNTTNAPNPSLSYSLSWYLITAGNAPFKYPMTLGDRMMYNNAKIYSGAVSNDTVLVPFSYSTYHKAGVVLSRPTPLYTIDTLVHTQFDLQPYTTTETRVQF